MGRDVGAGKFSKTLREEQIVEMVLPAAFDMT